MSATITRPSRPRPAVRDDAGRERAEAQAARLKLAATRSAAAEDDVFIRTLREYRESTQIADPFKDTYGFTGQGPGNAPRIIEPPFNLAMLARLPGENNMLAQCIDAMATNCEGMGHRFEWTGEKSAKGRSIETDKKAQAELRTARGITERPNEDYTLVELRTRVRKDLEAVGNAYVEVGRDRKNRVTSLYHIPAQTLRITEKLPEEVKVTVTLPRGEAATQTIRKRFRLYVQWVGNKKVWFKEFGDPRVISSKTGLVETAEAPVPEEERASEVYHFAFYNPASVYGVPRWIGQMPSILGSRQAELTNLDFFKENAIPAMAILVSGGALTNETMRTLESHFTAIRGRQSMNRVVVVEAKGDLESADAEGKIPIPKVELKPLVDERQKDGLFGNYVEGSKVNIRSSFRLPPLFVGESEDMTHATAKSSIEVGEMQVFNPERRRFDDFMNLRVLPTWGIVNWLYRSNGPKMVDPAEIIKAMEAFERMGALTPNVVIGLANSFFDLDIPEVEEEWGNYSFTMVMEMARTGRLKGVEKIADPVLEGMGTAGSSVPKDAPKDARSKILRMTHDALKNLGGVIQCAREAA